jgi:hypothetical protein
MLLADSRYFADGIKFYNKKYNLQSLLSTIGSILVLLLGGRLYVEIYFPLIG